MKKKYIAVILAILFGIFGIHWFYLRKEKKGVFYMVLFFFVVMTRFPFPITAFLGLIDGFRLAFMSNDEFNRKYNQNRYTSRNLRKQQKRVRSRRKDQDIGTPKVRQKVSRTRNNPFKKSGIKKYKDFDIQEALVDFEKGLKLEPENVALHFNMACSYSLLEDKENAFKHLSLAVKYGLHDLDKIQNHEDLAFVRIQPEYLDFKKSGFTNWKEKTADKEKTASDNADMASEKMELNDVLLAQLNRLMELRKKGVLTENEFRVERKKILSR